jgi:hypothetical protein
MVVRTLNKGRRLTGLNVGANNVRHYFPKNVSAIDLQLDCLQIQCGLGSDFWEERPEIHDPRLCDWLEFKYPYGKPDRRPVLLTMTLSEDNSFCVQSMAFGIHTRIIHTSEPRNRLDIMENKPPQPQRVRLIPPCLGLRAVLL